MSDVSHLLYLIPALPLAAAVLIAFLGPRVLKGSSHWPCILSLVLAFVVAWNVFQAVRAPLAEHNEKEGDHEARPHQSVNYFTWIDSRSVPGAGRTTVPELTAPFGLRADPLALMMACMVTFVGSLIAIFAAGYMAGDPGYPRFFAEVSLFAFSMLTLVLADNFLLLYLGWEGVGLCSYLLIGFWFAKPSAAAAARKAFLVTRIGDVGLILGIMLLWAHSGYRLDFDGVFAQADQLDHGVLVASCLLLFCGAAGKSAQFPLHVWLPDAMEGPTPVSALIHAATMVTAGVYLVARCTPLFELAPEAQLVVASIGGFTALFAALVALTQNDLKRVLAYSTLSQLGYMFLALGCGVRGAENSLVTFAVVAAVFHLFTHAFFKALLFLSAGSVMHAMGNVIDMRRLSGLRRVMPYTHWTFLCGALALSGFPLASGFWSKDEILGVAYEASKVSATAGNIYLLLFLSGMFTAALTAFYTFRAYFRTFWGPLVVPPEAGSHGHGAHDHGAHGHADDGQGAHDMPAHGGHDAGGHAAGPGVAHESPPLMTMPLVILAVFALFVGAVLGPTHLFAHFVSQTPGFPKLGEEHMNILLMAVSSLLALGGIGVAYLMYVAQPALPAKIANSAQALYQLSLNKFHFDELFDACIVKPMEGFASFCRIFDLSVLDSLIDLIGQVPSLIGWLFRPLQNGLVQFYALAMVLGLTVFVLAFARSL